MLKRWITLDIATKIYFGIIPLALIYHVLILTQIVDFRYAWGGQLQTLEQMYVFEAVSITLQLLFAGIIYVKAYGDKDTRIHKIAKWLTYMIAILFLINTLGNIFAVELFERVVFTPLTLIASIASFRIAID